MHRAIPVSNRFLSKKWEEHNQEVHLEKLRSMKPTVDANSPPVFSHTIKKAKREQLLEERYTEIERENRLLLEKMSSIMSGRPARTRSVKKRSLNQESRRRELVKISQENQALLRRLQERQPSYNIQKFEGDRKRTERLLQNICEFPYQLGVKTVGLEEGRRRFGSVDSRAGGRLTSRKTAGTTDRPRKLVPLSRDSSRNIVFKRGLNIRDKYFLIEIAQEESGLAITAFDIEHPDSYTLELDQNEAMRLMGGSVNYERLVSLLAFEGDELILVDQQAQGDVPVPPNKKQKPIKTSPGRNAKKSPPRERPFARSEETAKTPARPIEPFLDDLGKPSAEELLKPSVPVSVEEVKEFTAPRQTSPAGEEITVVETQPPPRKATPISEPKEELTKTVSPPGHYSPKSETPQDLPERTVVRREDTPKIKPARPPDVEPAQESAPSHIEDPKVETQPPEAVETLPPAEPVRIESPQAFEPPVEESKADPPATDLTEEKPIEEQPKELIHPIETDAVQEPVSEEHKLAEVKNTAQQPIVEEAKELGDQIEASAASVVAEPVPEEPTEPANQPALEELHPQVAPDLQGPETTTPKETVQEESKEPVDDSPEPPASEMKEPVPEEKAADPSPLIQAHEGEVPNSSPPPEVHEDTTPPPALPSAEQPSLPDNPEDAQPVSSTVPKEAEREAAPMEAIPPASEARD